MLKLLRCSLVILLFQPLLLAGQNKTFTLEDIFRNRDLFPKSMNNLQWIGSTTSYSYIDKDRLMAGNLTSQKDSSMLSLARLNEAIVAAGGDSIKRFPSISWISDHTFKFLSGNSLYFYYITEKKAEFRDSTEKDAENTDAAPLTFYLAYTLKNNLFVAINGKHLQITNDPDTGIVNGKIVHRNEWGIGKGTFWSPKGDLLAFYHMDESMVTQYPLVDIEQRPAVVKYKRYPMAGMTSHQVTIGVYDTRTGKTIFLETGAPPDQFLTNVTWTPDQKYILIAALNRSQNHMWMKQYDAATGNFVKTLFEETDEQYVEPMHGPVFCNKNPEQFIWQSKRSGYNQLYLYDMTGQLIKALTSGAWDITDFLGVDKEDKAAWFIAALPRPTERNLYRVELKTRTVKKVTEEPGTHWPTLSENYDHYIDNYSSLETSSRITICDAAGKQIKALQNDINPLEGYKKGTVEIITLKSADSSDLFCRLMKPADFDSTKKYPALIYVYGGPHSQMVTNSWLAGGGMYLTYLATKGYVVFTLDNHGTANRGCNFEQAIHRRLGFAEVQDQMTGVDYLKNLPYVDSKRIGVYGWSYGGFMTLSMLTQHPDDFKMGIAGGPVCDWKYYEVMYGERYMDTPQENPEGYEKASLLNKAENLRSYLLIIHGTMDETVVWQNSLEFLKNCIDKGKLVDYFVYPGHEHNVSGKDRLHLYRKIERYIQEHL